MSRVKRSRPRKKTGVPRQRASRREAAWPWRVGGVMAATLLALMVAPKSEAALFIPVSAAGTS